MATMATNTTPSTTPAAPSLTPEQALQREKKIQTLTAKISTLTSQISEVESQLSETNDKLAPLLQDKTPQSIIQRHIRLLHEYNEIKDIVQGLMGMIADGRGVRHVVVQREFGVAGDE